MKLALALTLLFWLELSQASTVDPQVVVVAPDGREQVLQWSRLQTLPRQSATGNYHGALHAYEGVSLLSVLEAGGIAPTRNLKEHMLRRVVTVEGAGGYRASFTLSELDPTIGRKLVLLVAHEDARPLARDDGPLRLVVPSDDRPARWVRQVVRIHVADVSP